MTRAPSLVTHVAYCVEHPAPAEAFQASAGFAPTSAEMSDTYCVDSKKIECQSVNIKITSQNVKCYREERSEENQPLNNQSKNPPISHP